MDGTDMNRWWGAAAAVACGLGFRYFGEVLGAGGVAGAAVVVGACFIMLMDLASGG